MIGKPHQKQSDRIWNPEYQISDSFTEIPSMCQPQIGWHINDHPKNQIKQTIFPLLLDCMEQSSKRPNKSEPLFA